MMRDTLALLLVAGLAYASPAPLVKAPSDWHEDPEASSALSIKVANAYPLGDVAATSAAQVYVPAHPGIGLSVIRSSAETGPSHAAAARAALDMFYASSARAELLGARVQVVDKHEANDGALRIATMTWNDTAQQLTTSARLVLAATQTGIVAVSGDCLWSNDLAPALVEACKSALATVDTGIAPPERRTVRIAEAPAAPSSRRPQVEPARIDDRERLRMSPMSIPDGPRDADRRAIYVGAGIVVLAAVFWWNRRRRDYIDRARAAEEGRVPAPATDDDADDLRAAARGDAPNESPRED